MSSPALAAYRFVTGALEPLVPAVLRFRVRRAKEDSQRLGERLGRASTPRPLGSLIWLHGASVGETLSLLPLVERLRANRPDLAVLVTSGTVTSAKLLAQRLPAGVLHQYAPVDAPRAAGRFLDHWRPDLAIFVESEVWPNLWLAARARGAKTALVSARLSPASLARWAAAPAAARTLLGGLDLLMAQDTAAADALDDLGVETGMVANLKFAGAPLPVDEPMLAEVRSALGGRPALLAASTHPGEDEVVLEAFASLRSRPDRPVLIIVPRHPVRGPEIAALAAARNWTVDRRAEGALPAGDVHVGDTLGELGLWMRLARAALIGGGLAPGVGGHNPLEAIRLNCPAASGPHVENWSEIYRSLFDLHGAACVTNADELAAFWRTMLDDPGAADRQSRAATEITEPERTALDRVWSGLTPLLPS